MMLCRECGIELEMLDELADDLCDACYEELLTDDDDPDDDSAFADDIPFPEFDWMEEWPE